MFPEFTRQRKIDFLLLISVPWTVVFSFSYFHPQFFFPFLQCFWTYFISTILDRNSSLYLMWLKIKNLKEISASEETLFHLLRYFWFLFLCFLFLMMHFIFTTLDRNLSLYQLRQKINNTKKSIICVRITTRSSCEYQSILNFTWQNWLEFTYVTGKHKETMICKTPILK